MQQFKADPVIKQKILSGTSNLIGKQVGYLTVIRQSDGKYRKGMFFCRCQCGKQLDVSKQNLISRKVTHCGCLRRKAVDPAVRAELEAKYNGTVSPAWKRRKKKPYNF